MLIQWLVAFGCFWMFWVACVVFFLLTTAQAMIKGFKVAFSAGGMNFMWQILRCTVWVTQR